MRYENGTIIGKDIATTALTGETLARPYDFLLADGITARDLSPLSRLQDSGFAVFIHGSSMTSEALQPTSDVDFAVIGDLTQLPTQIKEEYLPGIEPQLLPKIDYTSMSTRAANGRKISLHLQNPEFRLHYPDPASAFEYRDALHVKPGGLNTYFLGGADASGEVHMFHVVCPQIEYNGGVINYTPQTGIFHVEDGKAIAVDNATTAFDIQQLDTENGEPTSEGNTPQEFVIFGLELNKMSEDAPLDPSLETNQTDRFISQPIKRSLELVEGFTRKDPVASFVQSVQGRERLRALRKGKKGASQEFLEGLSKKLTTIYTR